MKREVGKEGFRGSLEKTDTGERYEGKLLWGYGTKKKD